MNAISRALSVLTDLSYMQALQALTEGRVDLTAPMGGLTTQEAANLARLEDVPTDDLIGALGHPSTDHALASTWITFTFLVLRRLHGISTTRFGDAIRIAAVVDGAIREVTLDVADHGTVGQLALAMADAAADADLLSTTQLGGTLAVADQAIKEVSAAHARLLDAVLPLAVAGVKAHRACDPAATAVRFERTTSHDDDPDHYAMREDTGSYVYAILHRKGEHPYSAELAVIEGSEFLTDRRLLTAFGAALDARGHQDAVL